MRRPILGVLTAVVVAISLWLGNAAPGLAVANEAPSPPALGQFACAVRHGDAATTTIGNCPTVARASSSTVLNGGARRLVVGLAGALALLAVAALAASVAPAVVERLRHTVGRTDQARGPPVSAN